MGPLRRIVSFAEVLDLLRGCRQREHSDAVVRAKLRSSAGTTLSTRKSTQAGSQCPPRDSNSFWSGVDQDRLRAAKLHSAGATHRSLAQCACEVTHGPGSRSHLQHTSQDLQLMLAFLARSARDVSWWKSWRKSLSRWTDARLQVVQQICMQEAGQIERAAYMGAGLEGLASTIAMGDGVRLAHRWIKQVVPWAEASVASGLAVQPQEHADLEAKEWHDLWKVGRACQIDFGGVNNAPVVPFHLLTTCATSMVRSARTLLLVPSAPEARLR